MHPFPTSLRVSIVLACSPALCAAQEILFEIDGTPTEYLGRLVAPAGDHDRDGTPDFMLARESGPGRDSVEIRSGRNSEVLRVLDVGFARFLDPRSYGIPGGRQGIFAGLEPAGDVDADGVPDVLVGGLVLSGASGHILIQPSSDPLLSLAAHAFGLGDLDADGQDDVLVGTNGVIAFCLPGSAIAIPLSAGWIKAFSGASGSELFALTGGPVFGGVIGKLGDVDGDGTDDLATASFFATPCYSAAGSPFLEARSGVTGELLWQAYSGAESIARLSDLDADGVADLAALASGGVQRVYFRSGRTGALLFQVSLEDGGAVGWSGGLESIDDLDGDGRQDLVVGAPQPVYGAPEWEVFQIGPGYVVILSGRDGRQLLRLDGARLGEQFGATVASPGDLDGDGRPELIVGAPGHVEKDAFGKVLSVGRVQVFSLKSPLTRTPRRTVDPTRP